jgi:adenosylcobinamide-GDP ribazoletransferase
VTGALHLDALADTADALGAHTPERALEIMRDSTIGAFGATALATDMLIKTAALSALAREARAVRYGCAAGALSRAVPVALAAALPYARAGEGAGVALTTGGGLRATAASLLGLGLALGAVGADGPVLAAVTAGLTLALGLRYRRWLGGVTGDGLGAAIELTETALLVVAVAR